MAATDASIPPGKFSQRCHAVWCWPSCCCACNPCFHVCRAAVSNKKRRFERDGFDLDLTYLTSQILVHGFPATGLEHLYRNPRFELRRFLDQRHAERYKIYNFCCEPGRHYDRSVFHGRVERYPFKDHSVPPLEAMVDFNESAKTWLDQDPQNVVGLHCKAGKGRAGLMSVMLLFRVGAFATVAEARQHYDATRVSNGRGLTVPSQQRYAGYYERLWREVWDMPQDLGDVSGGCVSSAQVPPQPQLRIAALEIVCPGPWLASLRLEFEVLRVEHHSPAVIWASPKAQQLRWDFPKEMAVERNFCVKVSRAKTLCRKKQRLFEAWMNSGFLELGPEANYVEFGLDEVDSSRKVKRRLDAGFQLRIYFSEDSIEACREAKRAWGALGSGAKDSETRPARLAPGDMAEARRIQEPPRGS